MVRPIKGKVTVAVANRIAITISIFISYIISIVFSKPEIAPNIVKYTSNIINLVYFETPIDSIINTPIKLWNLKIPSNIVNLFLGSSLSCSPSSL